MKFQSVMEHSSETDGVEVKKNDPKATVKPYNPALESLYFRSFGSRPLLNKDSEIILAKEIDTASQPFGFLSKKGSNSLRP